jgi:hypothetical protein
VAVRDTSGFRQRKRGPNGSRTNASLGCHPLGDQKKGLFTHPSERRGTPTVASFRAWTRRSRMALMTRSSELSRPAAASVAHLGRSEHLENRLPKPGTRSVSPHPLEFLLNVWTFDSWNRRLTSPRSQTPSPAPRSLGPASHSSNSTHSEQRGRRALQIRRPWLTRPICSG